MLIKDNNSWNIEWKKKRFFLPGNSSREHQGKEVGAMPPGRTSLEAATRIVELPPSCPSRLPAVVSDRLHWGKLRYVLSMISSFSSPLFFTFADSTFRLSFSITSLRFNWMQFLVLSFLFVFVYFASSDRIYEAEVLSCRLKNFLECYRIANEFSKVSKVI